MIKNTRIYMGLHLLDKYIYMAIAAAILSFFGYYKYIQHDRASLQQKLDNVGTVAIVIKANAETDISNKENSVKHQNAVTIVSKEYEGNTTELSDTEDLF